MTVEEIAKRIDKAESLALGSRGPLSRLPREWRRRLLADEAFARERRHADPSDAQALVGAAEAVLAAEREGDR
jgi:hypothetical protein